MSTIDLKRHPESKTPAIPNCIRSPGNLAVEVNPVPKSEADAPALRTPRFANGVPLDAGPQAQTLSSQPRFCARRQMTLVPDRRRRRRQVAIYRERDLRTIGGPRLQRKPCPRLSRQLDPPVVIREFRRPQVLDRQPESGPTGHGHG